ncbi:hypothetical protein [Pantoea sp. FN0305]|uniref:hypothetical protein n=1 Tax=Pantoea sp. FN0305 TaxID=3418559 RepID=UPI003CEC45EE
MSITLKEKLKAAKQEKERNNIKDDVIKSNNLLINDVDFIEVPYQEMIIELEGKGLELQRDNHDVHSQYSNYQKFIERVPSEGNVFLYCSGKDMYYFISVSNRILKSNPKYFWESSLLHFSSQDRIFIDSKKKYGFAVLTGEYGIETCQWGF